MNENWTMLPLTLAQAKKKHEALEKHRSECNYSDGFLNGFVRANELFSKNENK
jgi:hypothetical protein